ncbi:MAG TPA: Crp/Fnr family transcriptional regulator [Burkholderiales bacterium]|jgi:CRP/FNR family cyclic AMP-dependent transcriptional regulator|nr:Crp/Fnr family transcriptional regulator [Burkholderiales bacterium]
MPVDLKGIPLFQGVSDADLRALAERAGLRTYPKQAIIVSEGDETDSLYVVLSGRVKIYLADEHGKELILAIKGPGQYFGEMVLDGEPRSASVMTLEPSQFAILSRADFRAFLVTHAEVALQLIHNLIRVARGLNHSVRNLAMLDVYGRVARILLDLAVERDGKLVIPERLTQKDIAARVGASREMINRILRDLTAGGYVSVQDGRITINKAPPARW